MNDFKLLAVTNLIVIAAILICIFAQLHASSNNVVITNNELTVRQELVRPKLAASSRSGYLPRERVLIVKATAYSSTGNRTSSGTWPTEGRTIAVDPDTIPLGSTVYIKGLGQRIAEDTIPQVSINKGAVIDIFMGSSEKCLLWGRREIQVTIKEKH